MSAQSYINMYFPQQYPPHKENDNLYHTSIDPLGQCDSPENRRTNVSPFLKLPIKLMVCFFYNLTYRNHIQDSAVKDHHLMGKRRGAND